MSCGLKEWIGPKDCIIDDVEIRRRLVVEDNNFQDTGVQNQPDGLEVDGERRVVGQSWKENKAEDILKKRRRVRKRRE